MTHEDTIDIIKRSLINAPGIDALFLSGSFGNGMADAFSDIDFVLVAEDGATDEIVTLWKEAIAATGEIVLWWDRLTVPVLVNAITADWTRTDLIILKPAQMAHHSQATLKPLFDHKGVYGTLKAQSAPVVASPAKLTYQFEEFIRILGLLPLAVGREEYINGVLGVFHLRNLLVDLLIEETGAPHRGGVLHLNRLITQDQKDLLINLPPPVATHADMIAAHLAYAKAYLPRAKALAAARNMDWPHRFEQVTWQRLRDTLSIEGP